MVTYLFAHHLNRCILVSDAIKDSLIFDVCITYIASDKWFIYDYGIDYEELKEDLELINAGSKTLSLATPYCKDLLRAYLCNYVYPGCSNVTGLPQGICKEDCRRYVLSDACIGFSVLEQVTHSIGRLTFTRQCDNTLLLLQDYDINTGNIDHSDCFNITGKPYNN